MANKKNENKKRTPKQIRAKVKEMKKVFIKNGKFQTVLWNQRRREFDEELKCAFFKDLHKTNPEIENACLLYYEAQEELREEENERLWELVAKLGGQVNRNQKMIYGPTSEKRAALKELLNEDEFGIGPALTQEEREKLQQEENSIEEANKIIDEILGKEEQVVKSYTRKTPSKKGDRSGRFPGSAIEAPLIGCIFNVTDYYNPAHPEWYGCTKCSTHDELGYNPGSLVKYRYFDLTLDVFDEFEKDFQAYKDEVDARKAEMKEMPVEAREWAMARWQEQVEKSLVENFSTLAGKKAEPFTVEEASRLLEEWNGDQSETRLLESRLYGADWSQEDEYRDMLAHRGFKKKTIEEALEETFQTRQDQDEKFEKDSLANEKSIEQIGEDYINTGVPD